jgi:GT2 family glycosyltransferase
VLRKLHGVGAVKVSVVIVTYKRAWALPYSLSSIASQTRKADEVIVVIKPSGMVVRKSYQNSHHCYP